MFKLKKIILVFSLLVFGVVFCIDIVVKQLTIYYVQSAFPKHKLEIDTIDFSLINSSLKINKAKFFNQDKKTVISFFEGTIDFDWKHIINKNKINQIKVIKPLLNVHLFPKLSKDEDNQSDNSDTLELTIDEIILSDGRIDFKIDKIKDRETINLSKVNLKISNITTKKTVKASHLDLNLRLFGHADFFAKGDLSFFDDSYVKKMKVSLKGLNIPSTNETLRSYIPIDITKGELSIYTNINNLKKNGKMTNKVFLDSVDVISKNQRYKGTKHFFTEVIAALGNWLLMEDQREVTAIIIPLVKMNGEWEIDESKLFWQNLKNDSENIKRDFSNML